MDEQDFSVRYDSGILRVAGAVEGSAVMALREAIVEHSGPDRRRLRIDVSDVDFLASVGVAVLARAVGDARRQGSSVEILARSGSIAERVLAVSGVPYTDPDGTDPSPDENLPA